MKVLLDGYVVPDWNHVGISMQMLSLGIYEELKKFPIELVTVFSEHRHKVELPKVDAVVVVDFYTPYIQEDLKSGWLKEQTGAKTIISLCECSFGYADHSFVFDRSFVEKELNNQPIDKCTYIPNPCILKGWIPRPKIPKSVLIDYQPHFQPDWTMDIADWTSSMSDYSFSRIVIDHHKTFPHETRIPRANYLKYIDNTEHFERFIITHWESYGFSCIDLAYRGTELFCPVGFLRPCMLEDFNVKQFNSKEQLHLLLRKPYQPTVCTSYTHYDKIAEMIYSKIVEQVKDR